MTMTKVFQSGDSQSVHIPHEFHLNASEVEIFRRGNELILCEKRSKLTDVLDIFSAMPDDFMDETRNDPPPQERDFNL